MVSDSHIRVRKLFAMLVLTERQAARRLVKDCNGFIGIINLQFPKQFDDLRVVSISDLRTNPFPKHTVYALVPCQTL